jgi:flagellar biosynthesis protein FlhG
MQRILPIASGKGGVGKSVIAANLGLALAGLGKTVVLVDLDLGGSNLHTCLGLRNRHPGLGSFAWKVERSFASLLVETGHERLWLVPGDNLMPGTANLDWNAKRRILKELSRLPADFVILDLGAGSSYNVVDFYLAGPRGLVVLNPEITSVLNAYSFLKTAAFRILARSFRDGSPEKAAVLAFAGAKTEGSGLSFIDFARDLGGRFPEKGLPALAALESLGPQVVLNRGRESADAELGYRLRDICRKNLGIGITFTGFLLEDPELPRSVAARSPLIASLPSSPFSRAILALARRLVEQGEDGETGWLAEEAGGEEGKDGEGDLERLAAQALGEGGGFPA